MPEETDLETALGSKYKLWKELRSYTLEKVKGATEEWSYSKFGWNYKIKDKKRAIIYLMPCDKYFKASFVLGEKAVNIAMDSTISDEIKEIIKTTPVYAEGTGFRMDVKNLKVVQDIKVILDIKLRK